MDSHPPLPSGSVLTRNALVNLAGYGLPLLAAVAAIPALVAGLGTARFGFLTLAWALVAAFGVLDLGIGRALTRLVADRLGSGREAELPPLVGGALVLLGGVGAAAGALLAALAPQLAGSVLRVPPELVGEAVFALRLLSAALPCVTLGAGLRGVLEARQRFGVVNAVRLPAAVAAFAGPLAILPWASTLPAVAGALCAVRVGALAAYAVLGARALPGRRLRLAFDRGTLGELLRQGGWMTVSNVLAPLLLYMDRFVLGALATLSAVAHYTIPFEVVARLGLVPAAVMGVMFPAFATALARERGAAAGAGVTRFLYRRSLAGIAGFLVPACALLALLARPALGWWLGPELAAASVRPAQILALGALLHGLAQPSFHLLQAAGRADLTAKLHLLEAPLYALYLVALTFRFGAEGAALAWTLRVGLSAAALTLLARHAALPREPGR